MKRLILVDDDPAILDVFGLIFTDPEYAVTVYHEPEPLLSLKAGIPDLIFLDKQLAGTDGLEVCRKLKKNAVTRQVPVIMISASPEIRQLAFEAGAVAAIEKPFSVKEIRQLVRRTLAESPRESAVPGKPDDES